MRVALALLALSVAIRAGDVQTVFTPDEMAACTRLRSPSIMRNENTGRVHFLARSCGKNRCSQKKGKAIGNLGDDDGDARVVMKTSDDEGRTWNAMQYITPKDQTGFSKGAGLYDRVRDRLVVQYQYLPGGVTDPTVNTTYFQVFSATDGATWSAPVDITAQLRACNPDPGNMMCQSAGSKTQTASGRLLWAAHDHANRVCLWWSDDGGETYNTTALMHGNEISVAVAGAGSGSGSGRILMSGRGQSFSWKPYRTQYWSDDDGASWGAPEQAPFKDDGGFGGVEAALANVDGVLYFAEPTGEDRTSMKVWCSVDGGVSWPYNTSLNGNGHGGYSAIVGTGKTHIVVVWEDGGKSGNDNMYSVRMDTSSWCKCNVSSID